MGTIRLIRQMGNEKLIKSLKKKLESLRSSVKGDYESGYNDGYSVAIEDVEGFAK